MARRSAAALAALTLILSCRGSEEPGVEVATFVDHHVHVFNVGWWLLQEERRPQGYVNASGATSEREVVDRVAAQAARVGRDWVTGAGWNQGSWGTSVLPTLDTLSRAVPRNPVALARSDGHALWVNRAAIAAAGGDARPEGVLLERDVEPIVARIPVPADSDIVAAWRLGAATMASRGVRRVYDAGVLAVPGVVALNIDFARFVRLLASADAARPLPLEINLMIPAPSAFAESALVMAPAARRLSPNVRVTHLKLFADGALGSRGAALSHSYADDPHTEGILRMDAAEIGQWTRRALDAGLDVATHAIGDRAVKAALDAYEAVLVERPDIEPGRLRIEHFSYAGDADFERAARLGIALSVQSGFNSPRGTTPTFGEQRVGAANAERVYAWERLEGLGALLVEGSDAFADPGPALVGFHAALTGINAIGERGDAPEVRERALRLQQAWLAPGGAIEPPGRSGARVRLSADPLRAPLDSLLAIRVLRVP